MRASCLSAGPGSPPAARIRASKLEAFSLPPVATRFRASSMIFACSSISRGE